MPPQPPLKQQKPRQAGKGLKLCSGLQAENILQNPSRNLRRTFPEPFLEASVVVRPLRGGTLGGLQSCRAKAPRISRIFVPNLAPNFHRSLFSSTTKGPGEKGVPRNHPEKSSQKLADFECRVPCDSYGRDRPPVRPLWRRRILSLILKDFLCFVSWKTETAENSPTIPIICRRQILRQI